METSLSYLPEKNQKELTKLTNVIDNVLRPDKIILFGSYARGRQANNNYLAGDNVHYEYTSDYDILVVLAKNPSSLIDKKNEIEEWGDKLTAPLNLEIHEINHINEGLEVGQYFFSDIVKEGIVLLDRQALQFAEPRELTAEEKKQIAVDYFKYWIDQAEEFIIDATNGLVRNSYRKSVFELHQATESLYFALLLVFTGYKPKIHNLKRLRNRTKVFSLEVFNLFQIDSDKSDTQLFELLKKGYIDARYKLDFQVSKDDAENILARIKQMKLLVSEVCQQKIESMQ